MHGIIIKFTMLMLFVGNLYPFDIPDVQKFINSAAVIMVKFDSNVTTSLGKVSIDKNTTINSINSNNKIRLNTEIKSSVIFNSNVGSIRLTNNIPSDEDESKRNTINIGNWGKTNFLSNY